ncbi:MAG: hypothetical protein HZB51_08605 [Chloroflexi bacterium]|nr:hypothetical protein [Chloroflexota bacterium]
MSQPLQLSSKSRKGTWSDIENVLRSHKLALLKNRLQRAVFVGNYWYWVSIPELSDGIDIASIVCPLRYDVLVRRDFFSFYAAHCDLYEADHSAFVACTKETSYYTWYLESESVRTNKHLRGDVDALAENFVERIDRAVALYKNVQREGFSNRFPITLKTAKRILLPTTARESAPTSKHIRSRYFLADGCHRLALLMVLGYQTLPPDFFRVKYLQRFSPFDSTSLLAHRLISDPANYFRFLSSYYTAPFVFTNRNDFLGYIEANKPEWIDEVESVIHADGFDA